MSINEKYSLEKSYSVYDNKAGVSLKVGPDADVGGWVEISTKDKTSKEYFGDIRIVMEPAMARLLGQALIQAANDAEENK